MSADLKLFHDFEQGGTASTLRIYSWEPRCISVGYSQKLISKPGWDFVKRPTGGGIVFHNEAEVTYSLVTSLDNPLLPKGLVQSYQKLSQAVVRALAEVGVTAEIRNSTTQFRSNAQAARSKAQMCFSYPAEYEIVVAGPSTSLGASRKIVGSAQKRGKKALLQQGSIFMKQNEFDDPAAAISVAEVLGRVVSFGEMSEALKRGFEEVLGVRFEN